MLNNLITDEMSQYQQLKSIYDYCVTSFTYSGVDLSKLSQSRNHQSELIPDGYSFEAYDYDKLTGNIDGNTLLTKEYCYLAEEILQTKQGVCDGYTAAFVALANAIGFEAHAVGGSIKRADGNCYAHAWAFVKLDDIYYIFDPQAEQFNMQNGKVEYLNFGTLTSKNNNYSSWENKLDESLIRRKLCIK